MMYYKTDTFWLKVYPEIYNNSPDGILIINMQGHFVDVNPAYCTLTGYSREELLNMTLPDLEAKSPPADTRRLIKDIINSGKTYFETTQKRKDNSIIAVKINASILKIEQEPHFIVFVRDITKEEKNEKLQEQILQNKKMDSIGMLVGGMAHEFNNLLTVIQGYTDMISMKLPENSETSQYLKEIGKAATQAASITRQLLLFGQRQALNLNQINLNKIITELLTVLNRLIDKRFYITPDLTREVLSINADSTYIEQIIINMVINARDAMPEGGEIIIGTENINIDENYCKLYNYAHCGKFVCLSIKDTGIGMNNETIFHIFEPFFTTKEPGKAIGLGLSVVYGLVKQHGGWINVESQPGEGAIFKLYFPAVVRKEEEEGKKGILDEFKGKGERILLVEDETAVRLFSERALKDKGYIVFSAASTKEAIEIFEKENGKFDLIFSDIVLPDEKGTKLVEKLLALKPDLNVLFASGYTEEPIIQQKKYRFLQKPYMLTELLQVIRELVGKNNHE